LGVTADIAREGSKQGRRRGVNHRRFAGPRDFHQEAIRIGRITRVKLVCARVWLPSKDCAAGLARSGAVDFRLDLPRLRARRGSKRNDWNHRISNINYHRPVVNKRKVWGRPFVPYGQVWRAGANENTTIEVTDRYTIEGSAAQGKLRPAYDPEEGKRVDCISRTNPHLGAASLCPGRRRASGMVKRDGGVSPKPLTSTLTT